MYPAPAIPCARCDVPHVGSDDAGSAVWVPFAVQIGPSAVLQVPDTDADVQIAVSSVRNQCPDLGYFRVIGHTPETERKLAAKSTVYVREENEPFAQEILATTAPEALSGNWTQAP